MNDDLLRELIDEIRGLRADLRRAHDPEPAWRWLVGVLEGEIPDAPFNAEGVRELAADVPELLAALRANSIDLDKDPRSAGTKLGVLLGRLADAALIVRCENRIGAYYRTLGARIGSA